MSEDVLPLDDRALMENGSSSLLLLLGKTGNGSGGLPDQNRTSAEGSASAASVVVMVLWARILWDALFFSIILVAIVGNLIVLWVVVGKEQQH